MVVPKVIGTFESLGQFSWFIGCFVGFIGYYALAYRADVAGGADEKAAAETS